MINNLQIQFAYGLNCSQGELQSAISCHTITWHSFDTLSAIVNGFIRLCGNTTALLPK
jgi:hypothetical protein